MTEYCNVLKLVFKLLFIFHNSYIFNILVLFSLFLYLGIVEASKDLECEVVWHPSFSSSATGEFDLCVHEGKTLRLKCFAKVLV